MRKYLLFLSVMAMVLGGILQLCRPTVPEVAPHLGSSYPTPSGNGIPVIEGGLYAHTALQGDSGQFLKWGTSPTWANVPDASPAGSTGTAANRPDASGTGSFYFPSDVPVGYFDDPTSVAWKQFPFPLFTGPTTLASSYTVVGGIALSQVADAVSAITTVNTASNAAAALVAGSLGVSATWVVTLKAQFQPGYGLQYPSIGAAVTDGTTSGTSNVYSSDCDLTALGYYLCHKQKATLNGARISASTDIPLNAQIAGTGGAMYFRILADGTNTHFQLSNNGARWVNVNVEATPSSLTNYGFILGNPFSSTNSYGQAWILENRLTTLTQPQLSVSAITNATPAVVTTTTNHNLVSGDMIALHGAGGAVSANTGTGSTSPLSGAALVNVLTPTTFQMVGVAAGGVYTSGGTVTLISR